MTMTEKIKDRMFGWLVGLLFVLLGWIAGGVGWLVAQGVYKDAEQDRAIIHNENNISKIARVQANDPDTDDDEKQELRPIYIQTRGGNSDQ